MIIENILMIKIMAIFFTSFFKHPILQIISFTDMKMHLYARDMNSNRTDENKYVEIQKFEFLKKQNGESVLK